MRLCWDTLVFIYVLSVAASTLQDRSSFDRDYVVHKDLSIYYRIFTEKLIPIPEARKLQRN